MASEPYLAGIFLFAGNFAPRGYALCQGQLMSIAQNSALFSLLGTYYGGDGQTTFGLPNLQGRAPVGTGQGPGLPMVNLGEQGGAQSVTLTTSQMPAHNHACTVTLNAANDGRPRDCLVAVGATQENAKLIATKAGNDLPCLGLAQHFGEAYE